MNNSQSEFRNCVYYTALFPLLARGATGIQWLTTMHFPASPPQVPTGARRGPVKVAKAQPSAGHCGRVLPIAFIAMGAETSHLQEVKKKRPGTLSSSPILALGSVYVSIKCNTHITLHNTAQSSTKPPKVRVHPIARCHSFSVRAGAPREPHGLLCV